MRAIVRKRLRAARVAIGAVVGLLIHQMEGGGPLPHVPRGVATAFLTGFRAT